VRPADLGEGISAGSPDLHERGSMGGRTLNSEFGYSPAFNAKSGLAHVRAFQVEMPV
jgi:hypothetical protein